MIRSRYYAGANGRCYLYASDATVACPNQLGSTVERSRWEEEHTELVAVLASAGLDAFRLMSRSHQSLHGGLKDESNPGVCRGCGSRLVTRGYQTWIEAPLDRLDLNDVTRELNERLGSTHMRVPGSTRYWPVKREAIAWAREEAQIDKAAAREEVRS